MYYAKFLFFPFIMFHFKPFWSHLFNDLLVRQLKSVLKAAEGPLKIFFRKHVQWKRFLHAHKALLPLTIAILMHLTLFFVLAGFSTCYCLIEHGKA